MAIYKQFHKAWGITGQIGQEYRWEKDLKWSPMTSVLKGRECPKGIWWNGHVLTAQEGSGIREPRRSALQVSFFIFNMGTWVSFSYNYCLSSMSPYHTRGITRSWQKSSGPWEARRGCPQGGDRTAALRQRLEGSMERCWQRYFLFILGASFRVLSVWGLFFAVCWREFQFLGFILLKAFLWILFEKDEFVENTWSNINTIIGKE